MKGILHSICIGSLALALTAWGQQANDTTTVKAKAKKPGTSSAQVTTSANTGVKARTSANIAGTRSHKRPNMSAQTSSSVHAKVNVNDTTRFTNVTRVTSNGRAFNRAVFRDRNDRRFHLGFHDRIFFINNFSEVILINGCSFFLDEGIFWPAFIIGENCVPPRNVVFVAVD